MNEGAPSLFPPIAAIHISNDPGKRLASGSEVANDDDARLSAAKCGFQLAPNDHGRRGIRLSVGSSSVKKGVEMIFRSERIARNLSRGRSQRSASVSTSVLYHPGIQPVPNRRHLGLLLALWIAVPALSQEKPHDLADKSIEELMNMEVTSASKKEQKLSSVPAAMFVITREDIRNSGANNIPDLLRMVPGLDVAQINASTWAVSARGFNLQFADKLLVLIDGRAVYSPLFGGVNWDTSTVPLDDIDRIEVIRGPGGTVWGANAVNGVINVITKSAADTQGGLVTGGGGTQQQGFGTVQYGGKFKDSTYRIFTMYENDSQFPNLNGQDGFDDHHLLHGGFRVDSTLSSKDSLVSQGDLYTGNEGSTIIHSVFFPPDNFVVERLTDLSGGNLLTRWTHVVSSRCDTTVQLYFDSYTRNGPEGNEDRDTFDIDFQNHISLGARHDLIWGAGFRHTSDRTVGTVDQAFIPVDNASQLFNIFVQDQFTLKPDRVALYLGTKLENNYFSGFDLQPSIRFSWTPSAHRTLWGAISRASRTPTRRDTGLNATLAALPGPAAAILVGNPDFQSEHVIAYEVGYRTQVANRLSFDLTAFINDYSSLESVEPLPSYFDGTLNPPREIIPQSFGNKMYGTTEGVEAFAKWNLTNRWTLSPGYSFLEMHLHTDSSSMDTVSVADTQGSYPGHQAQLLSHLEISKKLAWDANAYFVGRLPAQFVSSYTRLDLQLTWRLAERVTLNVVGQNLLNDHHAEFNDYLQSVNSSFIKRSAYAKLTWQF
jgi:iron complex outermembrane recepter protein